MSRRASKCSAIGHLSCVRSLLCHDGALWRSRHTTSLVLHVHAPGRCAERPARSFSRVRWLLGGRGRRDKLSLPRQSTRPSRWFRAQGDHGDGHVRQQRRGVFPLHPLDVLPAAGRVLPGAHGTGVQAGRECGRPCQSGQSDRIPGQSPVASYLATTPPSHSIVQRCRRRKRGQRRSA